MFRKLVLAASVAVSFTAAVEAKEPLQLKVYNADGNSFNVTSTVISGETEAVVVDAGFTRADAYRIAANVLDTGKTLKTILVSNADPDYYFGVEVLKEIFPEADVVAPPAVLEHIKAKLPFKVEFWGPKMGANAPRNPVVPAALKGNFITVDGEKLEVRGMQGELAHRPYVWVPSLRAIVGNVGVLADMHVWMADTQKQSERDAWVAQLDEMKALHPAIVVPGHMLPDSDMDVSAIDFTRTYLKRFEEEAKDAKNADALMQAMEQAYPKLETGIALEISAKVEKGEMKW
ncbi:Zn-dependent Hydrolase, including glyoxylases [Hahella chejuensis KCTC 2396]|uniref:Zn-dependent Hydrolase, including glyoxylases n=1 Tax=Hahella chejuensis (strain KCTC 2396) TaxID=349521 RepID=Q2SMR4_HAHCH|nr:MBL fold metallo-hydrolase [Hahella chejuensis]ABC28060.1 Zn-dependent Hydrolase, including glyoxylases [Hahella chejuensis KCTC 2396]